MPSEDIRQEGQDTEGTHRELRQKIDELRRDLQGQIDRLRSDADNKCDKLISSRTFWSIVLLTAGIIGALWLYCTNWLGGKIDKVEDGIAETRATQQEMNRRLSVLEDWRLKGR